MADVANYCRGRTMSTHDAPATEAGPNKPWYRTPHKIVLAVGIFMGLFTLASGIIPQFTHWHGTKEVSREVFDGIPGALQVAFYTVIPVLLVWGAFAFSNRVKNWERGAPDRRKTTPKNVKNRLRDFRAGAYMQTLLRDSAAGLMHSMIYFGFLVLLGVTTVLEIDHQMPEDLKFLHGGTYKAYAFIGDLAGLVFVIGIVWAILRRYVQRPYRIRIKTKPEHAIILGVFLLIGLSGFFAEAFRIAEQGQPDYEKWSFIGYPLSNLFNGMSESSLSTWHQILWVVHVVAFAAFLIMLPITMLRHIFTSPLNMYLKDRDRPKGAMRAMPNLTETSLESFGASVVEDFTWKQLLDTDACTMCGRCTSVCPAHATGKPLDPREIVLKTGEVMAASANPVVTPPLSVDKEITISANSLFDRITAEEIWSCTSCRACDEICPVNIEILDKILDMRRYLSLMESNFPSELGNAYRAMENQGNPWGMNQGERGDWADGLDVKIVDPGEAFSAEYLYWVGCAGSFDDKNKKVTQAMAKLLKRAGIEVAILGPSEMCTGDSARRSGNEYLFQMLAMPNIEMLDGMGVKKIITQCPHCFNTLKNEYPQLGGNYEVVHHTQLLESLIASGKLDVSPGDAGRAAHLSRLVLPRSPQRRVPGAAQGGGQHQGHRGGRDAAQRHQGHVLRRRWRTHVDGGERRHQGERRACGRGHLDRRDSCGHRLPVLLHHARRRREGRRQGRGRGEGGRHRHPPARRHRGRRVEAAPARHSPGRPRRRRLTSAAPVRRATSDVRGRPGR